MDIFPRLLIFLLTIIIFFVGIVLLQIFLSKAENKWLGLILPTISLCFAILAVLSMVTYTTNVTTGTTTIAENGEIIKEVIDSTPKTANITSTIITGIYIFVIYNIPTAILLAIYSGCRGNRKKKLELDKMNIQDLE